MNELLAEILRYFAGNYQKIFIRLLLIYVLLYPIVAVYSILGIWGHKRILEKKELGAGPLVRERPTRNQYFGEVQISWRHSLGSWGFGDVPIRFEKAIVEKEKQERLRIREEQIQDVLLAARDLSNDLLVDLDDRPFLFVTIINDAFKEMTMNWLCNVQPFETILDRTLIIAGSRKDCEKIEEQYSEVSCVHVALPASFNGNFEERDGHRREFTAYRMMILERLAGIGLNFFYFDTDSLWLRDPFDLLQNATETETSDIAIGAAGPDEEQQYSSDPLLILASNRTRSFLAEARRLLEKGKELDLKHIMNKLCLGNFGDIKCSGFEWGDVADGTWFEYGPLQRSLHSPYIVNNNRLREIIDKTAHQEMNKMWLLKKGKCDEGLRKKLFIEYGVKEMARKLKYTNEKENNGLWRSTLHLIEQMWSSFRWNLGRTFRLLHIF
ncbi:hypothetical protein PENTCL1PPCAC_5861 [Pristionchus entomophagus]|uniref:Nucleotide-diphospho-sugar transferase domain-containing protein n=1 Tax=Pristionchus entomophagus TaxID=358040 RepID=A0AAV5SKC8_9BILA|nr:hypothetical protein PENTCL1PPCAC_5861 [Pristionchus entomophagus]